MNITLISYEGDEVTFDEKILQYSDFLNKLPDPWARVNLSGLKITTESLKVIEKYFRSLNYEPEGLKDGARNKSLFEEFRKVKGFQIVDEMDWENLLLLALACHKLNIRCLQNLVLAKIAEVFQFDGYEQAAEEFGVEVSDDEHLNNYLKFENKWASTLDQEPELNLFYCDQDLE